MRLCLTCFHIWHDDAARCGHCSRSFGGRLCDAKRPHISPPHAQYCVQCGRTNLTRYTRSLSLGWLAGCLAWAGVLLAFKWLWDHAGLVTRLIWEGMGWMLSHLFGFQPGALERTM